MTGSDNRSFGESLAPGLIAAFRNTPTAVLAEAMCGVAFTVRVNPADLLMMLKALDLARAGDVLVIDGGGSPDTALWGD